MSEKKNEVTAARIIRVEGIVQSEPGFKDKVKEKDASVEKRDGTKIKVNSKIVEIAQAMQNAGKDACTANKAEILDYAKKVLGESGQAVPAAAAAATATPDEDGNSRFIPEIEKSILTLLLSASQLSEHERKAGSDKRHGMLSKLVKEYQEIVGSAQ